MYLVAKVAEGEVDVVVLAGVRKRAHLGFWEETDFASVAKIGLEASLRPEV